MNRYLEPIEPTAYDWQEADANNRGVVYYRGEGYAMHPRLVYDRASGQCIGQLMPVDEEAVANSRGIQQWSKPA